MMAEMLYYDARTKIHEDVHHALRGISGSRLNITHSITDSATTGALWGSAVAIGLFLFGNDVNAGPAIPLFLVAIMMSYVNFKNDDKIVEQSADLMAETIKSSVKLPSLHGAPHDRLRDDEVAKGFYQSFKVALTETTPTRKFLFSTYMTDLGAKFLTGFIILSVLVTGVSYLVPVLLSSAMFLIGLSMRVAETRNYAQRLEYLADVAAFSLAEFGLRLDGKK